MNWKVARNVKKSKKSKRRNDAVPLLSAHWHCRPSCYIANAGDTVRATNTPHCMFFCWIYRLLVFGQRHSSHLSCFISELIYFRIIHSIFFFHSSDSFVFGFFCRCCCCINSLNQHEKCEHFVFHIIMHSICCVPAKFSIHQMPVYCVVRCGGVHAQSQLISMWLLWKIDFFPCKNDSIWLKGNFICSRHRRWRHFLHIHHKNI